jgi:hypothetical protein
MLGVILILRGFRENIIQCVWRSVIPPQVRCSLERQYPTADLRLMFLPKMAVLHFAQVIPNLVMIRRVEFLRASVVDDLAAIPVS